MKNTKLFISFEVISKKAKKLAEEKVFISDMGDDKTIESIKKEPGFLKCLNYLQQYYRLCAQQKKIVNCKGNHQTDKQLKVMRSAYFSLLKNIVIELDKSTLDKRHRFKMCDLVVSNIPPFLDVLKSYKLQHIEIEALDKLTYLTCLMMLDSEENKKEKVQKFIQTIQMRRKIASVAENSTDLGTINKKTNMLKTLLVNNYLEYISDFEATPQVCDGILEEFTNSMCVLDLNNFVKKTETFLNLLAYVLSPSYDIELCSLKSFDLIKVFWDNMDCFLTHLNNGISIHQNHQAFLDVKHSIVKCEQLIRERKGINKILSKIPDIISDTSSIEREIAEIEKIIEMTKEKIKESFQSISGQENFYKAEISNLKENLSELKGRLQQIENLPQQIELRIKRLNSNLSKKTKKLEKLKNREYQASKRELERQKESFTTTFSDLKMKVEKLKLSIKALSDQVAGYQNTIITQNECYSSQIRESKKASAKINALSAQLKPVQSEYSQKENSVKKLKLENRKLKLSLSKLNAHLKQIQSDLDREKISGVSSNEDNEGQVELNVYQVEFLELTERLEALNLETKKALIDCNQLNQKKNELLAFSQKLSVSNFEENKSLDGEIDVFNSKIIKFLTSNPEKLITISDNKLIEENIWEICQTNPKRLCFLLGAYLSNQELFVGKHFIPAVENNIKRVCRLPILDYFYCLYVFFSPLSNFNTVHSFLSAHPKLLTSMFPFLHEVKEDLQVLSTLFVQNLCKIKFSKMKNIFQSDNCNFGMFYLSLAMATVANYKYKEYDLEQSFIFLFDKFSRTYHSNDPTLKSQQLKVSMYELYCKIFTSGDILTLPNYNKKYVIQ